MNFVFLLIIGCAFGFVFYSIDRKRGHRWVKNWFDLTHKDPMSTLPQYGMVYRRDTINQIKNVQEFFGVLIFIGLAILGLDHPVTAIIDGAGAFVGAALAFLVAPFLFKLDRSQVEQVLQKLDESEGKFNNTSSQHSEKKQIVEEKK